VWVEHVAGLVAGQHPSGRRRLLVISPPGSAKSTWLSLLFPPWYLGNHPGDAILFFTSADSMARQFGGTVKSTLEGNERHAAVFPEPAGRPDPQRGWSSEGLYLGGTPMGSKDPAYRALGYGASVVGARANGIILDDPLTQEQAQSAVEQEKAKRYHDMTVDSRLHPQTGWEIAIMTRWHENDLASHLMAKADWHTVELPALGEYPWGEALWPERFPVAWLEDKRKDIGGPLFNTIYQGDPTGLGGDVFREASWFRPLPTWFDRKPLGIVQFWDHNFSSKTTSDYSVCLTLGVDRECRLYVLGVYRRRLSAHEHEAAMVEQIQLWRPHAVGVEEPAYKQQAIADLVQQVRRRVLCNIRPVRPSVDKVTRALLPAARAEAGRLFVDKDAPWAEPFVAECLGFPRAAHDDQVDALSGATQLAVDLLAMWNQQTPVQARFG
jgi:predicted phage terminase large subunit-like protein